MENWTCALLRGGHPLGGQHTMTTCSEKIVLGSLSCSPTFTADPRVKMIDFRAAPQSFREDPGVCVHWTRKQLTCKFVSAKDTENHNNTPQRQRWDNIFLTVKGGNQLTRVHGAGAPRSCQTLIPSSSCGAPKHINPTILSGPVPLSATFFCPL